MDGSLAEICVVLRYYAALNGNPLPTFLDNVSVPSSRDKKSKKREVQEERLFLDFWTLEDGTDTLYRNVGK
jgi:hypothetical protein